MEAISVQQEKNFYKTREHLFIAAGIVDEGQNWHGKSYPWALGIDSKIERWIGNTSPNT